MLTERDKHTLRWPDQSKEVVYDGKTYRSQRAWGIAMGFENPNSACVRYLKKGEYKGIKLERVKK